MKFNVLVVVPPGPLGLTIAADSEGFCSVADVKSAWARAFFKQGDILLSLNGRPFLCKQQQPPLPPYTTAIQAAAAIGNSINTESVKEWVEIIANSSYWERHLALYRPPSSRDDEQQQPRRSNDIEKAAAAKAPNAVPKVAAVAKEPADSSMHKHQNEAKTPKFKFDEDKDDPFGLLRVVKYIAELRRNADKNGKKPTLVAVKQIRWILFEGVMLLAENNQVKFGSQVGGAAQTWIRPTVAREGTSKQSQKRLVEDVLSVFELCTTNLLEQGRTDLAADVCKKLFYEHGRGRFLTDEERQQVCLFDLSKEILDVARREYIKANPPPKKIPSIFEEFPSVREEIVEYAKANVDEAGMVSKEQMVTFVNDQLIPAKMAEWMERHKQCPRRQLPENATEFAKRTLKLPYPIVARTVTSWLTALGFRMVQYHKSFRPPDKAPGRDELVHSQATHRLDHLFRNQPGETQCSAISTRGKQCPFIAIKPTCYCSVHADYDTNPPKPKKRRLGSDGNDIDKARAAGHSGTDDCDDGDDDDDDDDDDTEEEEHEAHVVAHQQQQQLHQHATTEATGQPAVVARHGYHRYY